VRRAATIAGTEGDQARWTLARKAQEMLRYGQSGQSVKTSTGDISRVRRDGRLGPRRKSGGADGTARSMPDNAPRGHRVTEVPEEDISAPRDVSDASAPRDGTVSGTEGGLPLAAGIIEQNKARAMKADQGRMFGQYGALGPGY
jgi:hypothetical protein